MRKLRLPLIALAVVALVGGLVARFAIADQTEGTTPNGWKIEPAGAQVDVNRFPMGAALSPDGSKMVVTSDNGGMQALTTVDTKTLQTTITPAANLFMGLAITNDGTVFASGGNADRVWRYKLAGPTLVSLDATNTQPFPAHHIADTVTQNDQSPFKGQHPPLGDGLRVTGYPGNMLLDGNLLYVAGTLSEQPTATEPCPGPAPRPACARVTIIDTSANGGMGAVVGRAPVGMDAYGLALDSARHRLYVSNWADESGRGGPTGGTVSVVDVTNPAAAKEIGFTKVGHHPEALQLSADKNKLFVTNTNDDTISTLDVSGAGAPTVITTTPVGPVAAPVGAHPDALALSPDGKTLFVALAGLNAVQAVDLEKGKQAGLIPTGYYPGALLVSGKANKYQLWVVNTKGTGFGPGYNLSVGFQGSRPGSVASTLQDGGSMSRIDMPVKQSQLKKWTDDVFENDNLDNAKINPCDAKGVRVSEVLCPPRGQTSPIKHVLYIVTENKTFDQYFGDINQTGKVGGYDADPTYTLYGQPFTPNHHKLADQFSLGDRFYSDAEVSVTGHSWTAGAIATDHNEKTWHADYDQGIRGTHGGGDPLRPSVGNKSADKAIGDADDELQDPEGGYIFEAFKRAGAQPPSDTPAPLTMAIYGERTARESGDMDAYKAPHWKDGDIQYFDTCRAAQFITGESGGGNFPNDEGPGGVTARDCEKRTLPGAFNLKHWTDVWNASGGTKDVMPNFIYMSLPVNHTLGTNLGSPTPASMVADNDYAVGQIVEALSHSPFWGSTVVMQTEDDTQAAGDHINSLRDYLAVSSPWAQPGPNHQWGSMPALLRTIEQIFGVQPISVYDKLAVPMHEAFVPELSDGPKMTPYTADRPIIPFAINQPGAPMQDVSMAQNWKTYDQVPMEIINAIQYLAQGKTPPAG